MERQWGMERIRLLLPVGLVRQRQPPEPPVPLQPLQLERLPLRSSRQWKRLVLAPVPE